MQNLRGDLLSSRPSHPLSRLIEEILRKDAGAATVNYGVFLNTLINFLIIAGVMFGVVKGMNRLKREEPAPAPPATIKDCPFCATAIPLRATRCPHCTSGL